jgi:serine/threonine protein kinase
MNSTTLGRTWDEASSPEVVRLVRRFESAWRATDGAWPDPIDFLPDGHAGHPGALLALLRADMALRRDAGRPAGVPWYRERYPTLDDEGLVALIYEEFCLREEAGETPDPAEYEAGFPGVAERLREVFAIHGLVAECPSTATFPREPDEGGDFPESGEIVAGFRLVEELGRGSFARVFRAEERRLANRPVVIKVARLGTREPQTLARLQHTHIVPVHSYRTDPARGLHLLCMPYFGGLTLARALADPGVAAARSGAELVAALDRLQPDADRPRSAGQRALAERTYPRAIAWWGARLAEALQHAHERGILHLDVKPSNILLTDDGLPMLLDFNLAREPWTERRGAAAERVGGTLAYMAPEHLEALLKGHAKGLDHRADIYSLALVLQEALDSSPGPGRDDMTAVEGGLRRLLEARRSGPPRPRDGGRPIPPALRAVLGKCLSPDPSERHGSAAELAADLQAVADAAPLRYAREPAASRVAGWLRRNRVRLAVAIPIAIALALATAARFRAQAEGLRRESEVRRLFDLGRRWLAMGDCATAADQFAAAAEQARGRSGLHDLESGAREMGDLSRELDRFGRRADRLRFELLGFGGDAAGAWRELEDALSPFGGADGAERWRRGGLGRLDEPVRLRLIEEVDELLFIWAVAVATERPGDPGLARRAIGLCDRAVAASGPNGPWGVLRDWWRRRPGAPRRDVSCEPEARACFRWGLLAGLYRDRRLMLAWLERARFLGPDDYWHQYALALHLEEDGDIEGTLRHYEAAVALRPDAPWAWFNRAHLYSFRLGAWEIALRDLDRAVASADDLPWDRVRFRIERGKVRQAVGDVVGARADLEAAIAADPPGRWGRDARLDRARLDAEAGAVGRGRAGYDDLLASDPSDRIARRARAGLSLRQGRAAEAEADLTRLLTDGTGATPGERADALAVRAVARLVLGRPAEAAADADAAARLAPTPGRARLQARAALAAGRDPDERQLEPDAIAGWPVGGPSLRADLAAAIERLDHAEAAHRARAAMLIALGENAAAMAEADRAVERSPTAGSYALRAEVRLRAGNRAGAMADVEHGLAVDPDDPRLLVLRGRMAIETGDPRTGLRWLDRAVFFGASGRVHAWRGRAMMALGRHERAVDAWSAALADDPDDAESFLGRAKCMRRLGLWENALADLQRAAERAPDGSPVLIRVTLAFVACLPARPDRFPRVVELAGRVLSG